MSHGQMARRRCWHLVLAGWPGSGWDHTLTGGPKAMAQDTPDGCLCIERRQQGSVRPGDEPGDGRARARREAFWNVLRTREHGVDNTKPSL